MKDNDIPGILPTKHEPFPGDRIFFKVQGYPPYKDISRSIRNSTHRIHDRYLTLREMAYKAMKGRKWYSGPIELNLTIFAPSLEKGKSPTDYLSGVFDSLDGSHGSTFTYLPVAYQDDCQICDTHTKFIKQEHPKYSVEILFL